MPTAEEMFDRWKRIAKDTLPRPWTQENLVGFFQLFRPLGEGLEAVFEDVVGADEILPRLREVYRATAEGWGQDRQDVYFVVRRPPAISPEEASTLARCHLDKLVAIAQHMEIDDLRLDCLSVAVLEGEVPRGSDDETDVLVYEMTNEFMHSLEPRKSHALLMREGLYYVACDNTLRHHILWPLSRHSACIEEPFKPYFELWKHGLSIRFTNDTLNVYVPNGKLVR